MDEELESFLSTDISYAIICRGSIQRINELKKLIVDYCEIQPIDLIYQKLSIEPLFIANRPSGGSDD